MSEQQYISIEIPEYAFYIAPGDDGKPWYVGIQISTSGSKAEYFLATPGQIDLVHRTFNRELSRVQTELRKSAKGLIIPEGVDSDALRKKGR
jgi:hypothetical protein